MRIALPALWLIACGGTPPEATPAPAAEPSASTPATTSDTTPEEAADPDTPDPGVSKDADLTGMTQEERQAFLMELGEKVFLTGDGGLACVTCHQKDGRGVTGAFPPLVGQKQWMGDCRHHAGLILDGLRGEIEVDGVKYNGVMVPQAKALNDLQIAAVISYVRQSWGNDFGFCTPEDVKAARG